ncbi:MAG: hypothetical protein M3Q10_12575, partial [Chloroflexota bacterium]|nr:hypothetical protein [Chloroflexota bacterium]
MTDGEPGEVTVPWAEGVWFSQFAGFDTWVAASGTDAAGAYGLAVTGGVAHGCGCPAGANRDPVCKHRAAYDHLVGLL